MPKGSPDFTAPSSALPPVVECGLDDYHEPHAWGGIVDMRRCPGIEPPDLYAAMLEHLR